MTKLLKRDEGSLNPDSKEDVDQLHSSVELASIIYVYNLI